jgi:phospholipid/cholesterol/gamma-HCH transport system substrate-binding protein
MRGRGVTLASNPVMVGALTVLIVVLAVFLAYNANNGLPFVPTYRISAQVPNANTLVRGNEVRIGGVRVGLVESIEPIQHDDGTTSAKLDLKLDKSAEPIPENSTVIVRSRSALGLKYLEIAKGDSPRGFPAGSTIPLSSAKPEPVEIDQVLNTFDEPTRLAIQRNLTEFGTAVAGRGPAINRALGEFRLLLPPLERVTRALAQPSTGLARFFQALRDTAAEVAPVADIQAQLFVNLDTTFGAFARVARPFIQETISKSPATEETTIRTLPRIRPFLAHTTGLFHDLAPGARAIRTTAPALAAAQAAGTPVLRDSPKLNDQLPPTANSLLAFNNDQTRVRNGLTSLTDLTDELTPTAKFIGPAQSVCNYATLLLRNSASVFSLGDGVGNWQQFIVFDTPKGPNNEGSPSSAPANGGSGSTPTNFLHANPYPNTASPGQQPIECEAGNETWTGGRAVIGNVPGNQGIETEDQTKTQLEDGRKAGGK